MRIAHPRPVVDTQEIAFQHQVQRGVEAAKSRIVSILGRQKFVSVRIGISDIPMGKTPVVKQGYVLHPLPTPAQAKVGVAIAEAVSLWLHQCHGPRSEHGRAGPDLVPPGSKAIYVAVKAAADAPEAAKRPTRKA
jgi:hypothetical protein